jgi:hypothetical protein
MFVSVQSPVAGGYIPIDMQVEITVDVLGLATPDCLG